jgi:hypothetical protein
MTSHLLNLSRNLKRERKLPANELSYEKLNSNTQTQQLPSSHMNPLGWLLIILTSQDVTTDKAVTGPSIVGAALFIILKYRQPSQS